MPSQPGRLCRRLSNGSLAALQRLSNGSLQSELFEHFAFFRSRLVQRQAACAESGFAIVLVEMLRHNQVAATEPL